MMLTIRFDCNDQHLRAPRAPVRAAGKAVWVAARILA
jgi:hypothetical protein